MVRRVYTRKEVVGLLEALERQSRESTQLAKQAEAAAARDSFEAYNAFRNKVGEFRALCILVEGRLRSMEGNVDDMRERYAQLDTLMLSLLVRASMRFFFVLSAKTVLPLGAREIFVTELRSLYDASEKLRKPEYANRLNESIRGELETAEMILEEIIDKAPSMLQFS
ncbi:hypothetical protein [Nitrospirillum iridis]|uniref:Uncharacterized protein n=1 Tax=Nitrospirillum iridis TaxID=765888 RepID=A0A7X0EFU0_9PROT|nr:hypothetical protein [Nitrospirillum iridis]